MAIIDFAKTTDPCWDRFGQTRNMLDLFIGDFLADFKYMRDFNEKNIYHLLSVSMENQIRIKAWQIVLCIYKFIEDPAITGLIIYLLNIWLYKFKLSLSSY